MPKPTAPVPAAPRQPVKRDEIYPSGHMPLPDVREENSDTAWDLWSGLAAKQDVVFADTTPASIPAQLPPGDPRYAVTVPSALASSEPAPKPAAPAGKVVSANEVMVEARRNNRLCPQPAAWLALYELLPGKKEGPRGWEPAPPVTAAAWSTTPSLAKRMWLRDHIEWADSHGGLNVVYAFLKNLSEDEWHHMGD
jgi:hypothetical protein